MAQPALNPAPRSGTEALEGAVSRTLAYFSLFSYVPNSWEMHRYLHGLRATPEQVRRVVRRRVLGSLPEGVPENIGQGAEGKAGNAVAPRTPRYGRLLGYLPYVRMIGLTGSRAMNGASSDDIDLMVVSAPGRVWLCRLAMVVAVRLARLHGDTLCPNYVVSAACLALPEMTIYDAHELAQMIPLYGGETYRALWARNPAVWKYLPNAEPSPGSVRSSYSRSWFD